ncbi:uncharacterized protein LOC144573768, partial [Carex rostrata]
YQHRRAPLWHSFPLRQSNQRLSIPLLDDHARDHILVIKPVLQQKISDEVSTLKEGHWTSACMLTITKFQSLFYSHDEASSALSFLSLHANARYLSVSFKDKATDTDFVQGVKLSLSTTVVSNLDYDLLKLVWTQEKLEKHIDIIDQNWERSIHFWFSASMQCSKDLCASKNSNLIVFANDGSIQKLLLRYIEKFRITKQKMLLSFSSRKKALEYFKSGNKEFSLRYIRWSKLLAETQNKSNGMLEKVEHLLLLLADAESTRYVAEAIKIGTKAIKEQSISIEEVHRHMEELDCVVSAFNDVQAALESVPVESDEIEDGEVEEEELRKEEVQETKIREKQGSQAHGPTQAQELADSVCHK